MRPFQRLVPLSCLVLLAAASLGPLAAAARPAPDSEALPLRWLSVLAPERALLAQAADAAKKKDDDPLPPGKGKEVTQKVCSGCHAVTSFSGQRHDADKWNSIIDSMVGKGLDASDQDLAVVANYLAT